jgi:hypothetical protein
VPSFARYALLFPGKVVLTGLGFPHRASQPAVLPTMYVHTVCTLFPHETLCTSFPQCLMHVISAGVLCALFPHLYSRIGRSVI